MRTIQPPKTLNIGKVISQLTPRVKDNGVDWLNKNPKSKKYIHNKPKVDLYDMDKRLRDLDNLVKSEIDNVVNRVKFDSNGELTLTTLEDETLTVDISELYDNINFASADIANGIVTVNLTNGDTKDVDLTSLIDNVNVDSGELSQSGILTLTYTNGINKTIDLSSLLDNINFDSGVLSSNGTLTITLTDNTTKDIDLSLLLDNVQVESGEIDSGILTLTFSDGSTIDIDVTSLLDDVKVSSVTLTEAKVLNVTLSNDEVKSVDLSSLLDNITVDSLALGEDKKLTLTLTNGGTKVVDLLPLMDNVNFDNATIDNSGNLSVVLTNGDTKDIDLSSLLDNVTVNNMELTSDSKLKLYLTNGVEKVVDLLPLMDNVNVTSVSYDNSTKKLNINLSNGEHLETSLASLVLDKTDRFSPSKDNSIVRFSDTNGSIQDSEVYVGDNGGLSIGTVSTDSKLRVLDVTDTTTDDTKRGVLISSTVIPTDSVTNNNYGSYLTKTDVRIPKDTTLSGYQTTVGISGYISSTEFKGTLETQTALHLRSGIVKVGNEGDRKINYSYALRINGYKHADSQIDHFYGIYQTNSDMFNYYAGKTGIGTTSKVAQLNVSTDSVPLKVKSTGLSRDLIQIQGTSTDSNNYVSIGANGNHMVLSTNKSERMRVTSGGRFGLGRTSPVCKLDVKGDVRASQFHIYPNGYRSEKGSIQFRRGSDANDTLTLEIKANKKNNESFGIQTTMYGGRFDRDHFYAHSIVRGQQHVDDDVTIDQNELINMGNAPVLVEITTEVVDNKTFYVRFKLPQTYTNVLLEIRAFYTIGYATYKKI